MQIKFDPTDIEKLSNRIAEIVLDKLKDYISDERKDDSLLTVDELASYLKVKKSWIYQKVHANEIKYHKVGNHLRFKRSEIDNDL